MSDRALRILKCADKFLEEHKIMTLRDWKEIILEVEKANWEEVKKKLKESKKIK